MTGAARALAIIIFLITRNTPGYMLEPETTSRIERALILPECAIVNQHTPSLLQWRN